MLPNYSEKNVIKEQNYYCAIYIACIWYVRKVSDVKLFKVLIINAYTVVPGFYYDFVTNK